MADLVTLLLLRLYQGAMRRSGEVSPLLLTGTAFYLADEPLPPSPKDAPPQLADQAQAGVSSAVGLKRQQAN
jgi:hypothetical protein